MILGDQRSPLLQKLIFLWILGGIIPVHSATVIFNNGGGDQKWGTLFNWSTNNLPQAADTASIPSGFLTILDSPVTNVNNIFLASTAGSATLQVISGGSISVAVRISIGRSGGGTGTYTQTGGTVIANAFAVGDDIAGVDGGISNGTISGGTLSVTNNLQIAISDSGSASGSSFTISGGSISVGGNVNIGDNGNTASLTVSGGTLSMNNNIQRGLTGTNVATLTLSGGMIDLQPAGDPTPANINVDTFNFQGGTLKNVNEINSGGAFSKTTSGTATLAGTVNFTGPLTVSAGTLIHNATWGAGVGSALTISNGAFLGGTGIWKGNLTNQGTIRPSLGGTTGKLTIQGTYSGTGAISLSFASPNTYDQLETTGNINLSGTTLIPLLASGFTPANGSLFTNAIKSTGGTLSNTQFLSTQRASNTLVLTPVYNSSSVDLLVSRNLGTAETQIPNATSAQKSVYNALSASASSTDTDLQSIFDQLDLLPSTSALASAMQELSPEKTIQILQFDTLRSVELQGSNIHQHLQESRLGEDRFFYDPLTQSFQGNLFEESMENLTLLASNDSDLTALALKKARPWKTFGTVMGEWGDQDPYGTVQGYNFNSLGITVGVDRKIRPGLRVGVATGWNLLNSHADNSKVKSTQNSIPLIFYSSIENGNWWGEFQGGYQNHQIHNDRKIQFATLDRTAEGDTDAHQFIGSLKTGYDFVFGKWSLTPMTEIDYSKAWIQSYAETGAQSLNLVYSPQEVESITSKTGMTINHEFTWGTTQLQPFLQTSYVHEFSGHPSSVQTRFVSGSSFETSIPEADPDYVEMGGGIAIQWDSRWRLKLSYQTDLARSSYESHRLDANLSFSF